MGCSSEFGKIAWLPLVIYGSSFLRYIAADNGCELDDGFVIVADNEIQARRFVTEYIQKNGDNDCLIKSWKKRREYPENYCCGFLVLKKYITLEEADDFLSEKDFLPIVICGGLFPDCLKSNRYIFRLREADLESIATQTFAMEIKKFRTYVIGNVEEVCRIFEEQKTSIARMKYSGAREQRSIYNFLLAVGAVYVGYWRRTHTEKEATEFFNAYVREMQKRLAHMPEFAGGDVLSEMLASLVWEYLYKIQNIVVADIEKMDEEVEAAIREQRVILYDEKFYYFPPALLMKICDPLLQTASETDLKRRLREKKIIYCNSADYTVKKTIVNVYGMPERKRFFWTYKDAMLSPDNLRLEDIYCQGEKEEAQ